MLEIKPGEWLQNILLAIINNTQTYKSKTMANITPYDVIGGEQAIFLLVERFYFYMDTLPEARGIRAMHQPDLTSASSKLFKYLSGWLGGPNLFIEEFGHPMLRARHLPFAIGESERDQWMLCMNKAIADIPMDPRLETNLKNALQDLATHMINQEPS
jgi:hemoglobin